LDENGNFAVREGVFTKEIYCRYSWIQTVIWGPLELVYVMRESKVM